jgi:15-cis-phytoene synthase
VAAQSNFAHCTALVHAHDRDRYLASLFAPAEHRPALHALYAFNVEIGRVREAAREPMPGEIRLQWWREVLLGERDSEAVAHPVAAALCETLTRYRIDAERLIALIDAHTFDLYDEPFATLDDLDNYAALSEGIVLGTAATILGAEGLGVTTLVRHAAIAMTIARSLILLPLHASRRQLYLPREVMDRHALIPESVIARQESDALRSALAEMRRHARRQLQAAALEAGEVPVAISPALLPIASVGPQLRRMERRGYEPYAPDVLSPLRRQWLIWRASRNPRRIFAV